MSLQEILRNIYYFIQLLEDCSTDKIKHWESEDLRNARNWAIWCEKFAGKTGQKHKDEVDAQIQQLSKLPWSLGSLCINLDLLSKASTVLHSILLQNVYIRSSLYSEMLNQFILQAEPPRQEDAFKLMNKLSTEKALVEVLRHRLPGWQENALHTAYAAHLLQYLSDYLPSTDPPPSKTALKTELLLRNKLKSLTEHKYGMNIIFACLKTNTSHIYKAQMFILSFLEQYLSEDPQNKSMLSNVEAEDIVVLVENSNTILSSVTVWMRDEADRMVMDIQHGKIVWRSPESGGLGYDRLLLLTQALIKSKVAETVKWKLIPNKTQTYSVWHDISLQLRKKKLL